MNIINIVCGFILLASTACSKPVSIVNADPAKPFEVSRPVQVTPQCSLEFKSQMTPAEVALVAVKMKDICKLTEEEIYNLADKLQL